MGRLGLSQRRSCSANSRALRPQGRNRDRRQPAGLHRRPKTPIQQENALGSEGIVSMTAHATKTTLAPSWYIVKARPQLVMRAGEEALGLGQTVYIPQKRKEYRHHRQNR